MPPFVKFRGHRRTSTPTSPNPSSFNTVDSPVQHGVFLERPSPTVDSPFDTALPSPRFHVPSFMGPRSPDSTEFTALPLVSNEEYSASHTSSFADQPRPLSSSSAIPPPTSNSGHSTSSFHGPQKLRSLVSFEHNTQYVSRAGERSFGYDTSMGGVKSATISTSSSERTLVEDYEIPKGVSSRTGKGRLNLLNPMSLLARRRSSQAMAQKHEELRIINTLPVPAMPDDYDPRIRGNIVHDFSAPRTRRNLSADGTPAMLHSKYSPYNVSLDDYKRPDLGPRTSQYGERKTNKSPEHAPHFKEDFSDDRPILNPASTGYLHAFAASTSSLSGDQEPQSMPAFARNLPVRLPDAIEISQKPLPPLREDVTPPTSPPAAVVVKQSPPRNRPPSTDNARQSPPRNRPPSTDTSAQASALPKHMVSNASRFSFDLNGVGSDAQEKLLEEKHKQKQAARNANFNIDDDDAYEIDEYADYGFDDDDGLEERIPGVNVDADDMDDPPTLAGMGLQQFHFTPSLPSAIMSPSTQASEINSFPTPRDEQGHAIGFATSKYSPIPTQISPPYYQTEDEAQAQLMAGLGISAVKNQTEIERKSLSPPVNDLDDEDMYFDDGDIQLGDEEADGTFDESIFDDETGMIIRDIPAENARNLQSIYQQQLPGDDSIQKLNDIEQPAPKPDPVKSTVLSEDNMAAFQKALQAAANEAALDEVVDATGTINRNSDGQMSMSRTGESHPGLISDDSRISQNIDVLGNSAIPDDYDFDDDEFADDLLIAEANAEVLEYDDEGFYGREFGFYAKATGKGNSEKIAGGFFVPRGMEGINRSHSGRANYQEPTLTPITERSEWSTRNSMASINAFGVPQSAHSLPSPAIADLLNQGNFEDDISLDALLRLRRGAWGGSQTSLHSSTSQASNSGNTHTSPRDQFNVPISMDAPAHMSSSVYSLNGSIGIPESEEEDEDDFTAHPTVTHNTPQKGQRLTDQSRPSISISTGPPLSPQSDRPRMHSRHSSGADSVSYIKDADGRFIVERKRTLDSGEIELIGREVLVGNI